MADVGPLPTPRWRIGALAWTNHHGWEWVFGPHVQEKHGVRCGWHGKPIPVVVRRSTADHLCGNCGNPIARRAVHGTDVHNNSFCDLCITPSRPKDTFRAEEDQSEDRFLASRTAATDKASQVARAIRQVRAAERSDTTVVPIRSKRPARADSARKPGRKRATA